MALENIPGDLRAYAELAPLNEEQYLAERQRAEQELAALLKK